MDHLYVSPFVAHLCWLVSLPVPDFNAMSKLRNTALCTSKNCPSELETGGGERKVARERIARGEPKSREARPLLTELGIARGLAMAHVNL